MEKRILSQLEEKILRLHHHDFDGLSVEDTAINMGMTVIDIKRHLTNIKRKAPQLFPILTIRHKAIQLMYDQHMSRKSIAVALSISEKQLGREITFLYKHGFLWPRKMSQYDLLMDGDVKEKF